MAKVISVSVLIALLISLTYSAFAEVPSDVPQNHWAYDAVELLIKEGIIKGYPDGTFKGNQTLTRYELAMIIYRLLDFIKAIEVKKESQEIKEQMTPQVTQPKESTKLSIRRREIPPNAYTGLVIDARGKSVKRTMSPKIYDVNMREIYGPTIFAKENHSLEEYILLGVVEYIKDDGKDLEEILKESSRAGSKPLVIKAVGTIGEFNDDIVVSKEDGDLILKEDNISKFLEDMAVVIVY